MGDYFTKVLKTILHSSLMEEEVAVRWAWVAILAMVDSDGIVRGTDSSLARAANLPLAEFQKAIKVLTSPDPNSTSPEEEGRRMVPAGSNAYLLVNYKKIRQRQYEEERRERDRERKAAARAADSEDSCGHVRTAADTCGQVRTGADASISTSSSLISKSDEHLIGENIEWVIEVWNDVADATGLKKIRALNDRRRRNARHRVAQLGPSAVEAALRAPVHSRFLRGEKDGVEWQASFDWIMHPDNILKVVEGFYADTQSRKKAEQEQLATERAERKVIVQNIVEYQAALLRADLEERFKPLARALDSALTKLNRSGIPRGLMCAKFFERHDEFMRAIWKALTDDEEKELLAAAEEEFGAAGPVAIRKVTQAKFGVPDPLDFDLEEDG